jgi:hypothetical protein
MNVHCGSGTPQAGANQVEKLQSTTSSLANPYLTTSVTTDGTPPARKRVPFRNPQHITNSGNRQHLKELFF